MKKEKFEELKSFEKLNYLIKRLGRKEVFDNLVEMMNESELDWFADELASVYDLLKD